MIKPEFGEPAIWKRVSDQVKGLVLRMCNPDPETRCSLEEAMQDAVWGDWKIDENEAATLRAEGAATAERMAREPLVSELF